MVKFKFVTGEVVEINNEAIAKILRTDKRYTEVKKGNGKAKDETPKGDEVEVKGETPEGDEVDAKVQE